MYKTNDGLSTGGVILKLATLKRGGHIKKRWPHTTGCLISLLTDSLYFAMTIKTAVVSARTTVGQHILQY